MRVGFETVALYQEGVDIDVYRAVAQKGDELGFDSMWLGHRIVLPKELPPLPPEDPNKVLSINDPATLVEWTRRNAEKSRKNGKSRHDSNSHHPDPWTLFSHLAAYTTNLKFASSVFILPLVNPFVTARAVTTADWVSGGRIILGIGVGWNKPEYDIVGESFETRGRRADEIVDILQMLWTQDTIEYHGKHYSFPPLQFEPKPKNRPPIIGGGVTPAALLRMSRLDGCWLPLNDVESIKKILAEVTRLRAENGRSGEPYEVTVHAPLPLTATAIRQFEEIGVDRIVAIIGTPPSAAGPEATAGSIPATSVGVVPSTAQALCDNLERIAEIAL